MQDVVPIRSSVGQDGGRRVLTGLREYLPRGNTLDEKAWRRRHRLLEWVLLLHVPGLVGLGLLLRHPLATVLWVIVPPVVCLVVGHLVTHHRWASFFVTGGLVFCSMGLVLLSRGSIEAHFHFFIIIGFVALYQDWVPFLWMVTFTVLSHGIGTIWLGGQIFNHPAAQQHPWLWSFIHGVAVLFACVGIVIFWRITEDEQSEKEELGRQLVTADVEIGRRQFTSDLLVNLARRNQSMLYRQLDIINQLEDKEQDPDALADLFRLDHLATRIRRNAESLLVLAGEQPPRAWSAPVLLRDVVRAAIAETEDLDRVVFAVDEQVAVSGVPVADLTHLVAELTENAVRFSPPETVVTIRVRPNRRDEGGQLLTIEDWGVGMPADDLADANELLARPRDVDLAVSQRLGFHVVARLAARHKITVSLSATPGSGITAVAVLPATLFTAEVPEPAVPAGRGSDGVSVPAEVPVAVAEPEPGWGDMITAIGGSGRRDAPADAGPWATTTWPPALPAPFVDAGPVVPSGPWHGWWSPDVPGAPAPPGRNGNGFGGPNGVSGLVNGTGRAAVTNGGGTGDAADGSAPSGAPEEGTNGVDRPARPPWKTDDVPPRREVIGDLAAFPADHPVFSAPPAVPDARRQPSPVARDGAGPGGRPGPGVPPARDGSGPAPAVRPPVRGPIVSRGPVAALPSPRPDDTAPTTPARGTPSGPGRGLRRRVPQSHLAPELRQAANGLADTAAPLAADAAASALSRYQASRRAAQSVVDHPDGSRPDDQGERA